MIENKAIDDLEKYLKDNLAKGIISFVIATHDYKNGNHWYIHPNNQAGETFDLYFDTKNITHGS